MEEPPAKRLRLSQSPDTETELELDEWVNSSRESKKRLEEKFNAIYEKYGNMRDEENDIIDLNKLKIEKDNGHIQSVNDDQVATSKFLTAFAVGDIEIEEDSEDELAPPGLSKCRGSKSDGGHKADETPNRIQDEAPQHTENQAPQCFGNQTPQHLEKQEPQPMENTLSPRMEDQPPVQQNSQLATPSLNQAVTAPDFQFDSTHLLNAFAQLPQVAQTPQTPLNGKNHNALLQGLGQFVIQTMSKFLLDNPRTREPFVNSLSINNFPEQSPGESLPVQTSNSSSSPSRPRQLPTPSDSLTMNEAGDPQKDHYDNPTSSGTLLPLHLYSDEDIELLSLAGDDETGSSPSTDTEDEFFETSASYEAIIPSIEPVDHSDNDELVVEQLKAAKLPSKPGSVTMDQDTGANPQSSSQTELKPEPANSDVMSESEEEEELDLVPTGECVEPIVEPKLPLEPLDCGPPEDLHRPTSPATPHIKRESSTPCRSLLAFPLKTPKSAPNLRASKTPSTNKTSRLSKSEFKRKVRAQWAKQGRNGTPQTLKRKRSLPQPRNIIVLDDSEDELAK